MKKYVYASTTTPIINELPMTQQECANQITLFDLLRLIGFKPYEGYDIAKLFNGLIIVSYKDNTIYTVDNYTDNGEIEEKNFPEYVINQYMKSDYSDLVKFCLDSDYFVYEHSIDAQDAKVSSTIFDDFYNF